MDHSGHTTLAEWTSADPASIDAAAAAFRAQLDEGYYAVVSRGEGHAQQVTALPVDEELSDEQLHARVDHFARLCGYVTDVWAVRMPPHQPRRAVPSLSALVLRRHAALVAAALVQPVLSRGPDAWPRTSLLHALLRKLM